MFDISALLSTTPTGPVIDQGLNSGADAGEINPFSAILSIQVEAQAPAGSGAEMPLAPLAAILVAADPAGNRQSGGNILPDALPAPIDIGTGEVGAPPPLPIVPLDRLLVDRAEPPKTRLTATAARPLETEAKPQPHVPQAHVPQPHAAPVSASADQTIAQPAAAETLSGETVAPARDMADIDPATSPVTFATPLPEPAAIVAAASASPPPAPAEASESPAAPVRSTPVPSAPVPSAPVVVSAAPAEMGSPETTGTPLPKAAATGEIAPATIRQSVAAAPQSRASVASAPSHPPFQTASPVSAPANDQPTPVARAAAPEADAAGPTPSPAVVTIATSLAGSVATPVPVQTALASAQPILVGVPPAPAVPAVIELGTTRPQTAMPVRVAVAAEATAMLPPTVRPAGIVAQAAVAPEPTGARPAETATAQNIAPQPALSAEPSTARPSEPAKNQAAPVLPTVSTLSAVAPSVVAPTAVAAAPLVILPAATIIAPEIGLSIPASQQQPVPTPPAVAVESHKIAAAAPPVREAPATRAATIAKPRGAPAEVRASDERIPASTADTSAPATPASPAPAERGAAVAPAALFAESRQPVIGTAGTILTPTLSSQAPLSQAPHDFAALVDRLIAARDGGAPQAVQATVSHSDFGRVSLDFRQDGGALSVGMTSADPGFAPAVLAALATERSASAADVGRSNPADAQPLAAAQPLIQAQAQQSMQSQTQSQGQQASQNNSASLQNNASGQQNASGQPGSDQNRSGGQERGGRYQNNPSPARRDDGAQMRRGTYA